MSGRAILTSLAVAITVSQMWTLRGAYASPVFCTEVTRATRWQRPCCQAADDLDIEAVAGVQPRPLPRAVAPVAGCAAGAATAEHPFCHVLRQIERLLGDVHYLKESFVSVLFCWLTFSCLALVRLSSR